MRTIVAGASSGLGRCIALGLVEKGAQVAMLARRQDLLDEAAAEAGPQARGFTCDVTDEGSSGRAVDAAAEWMGGVDGVVFCPALGVLRRIEDLTMEDWRRSFETNVAGASLFTAACVPHLRRSSGSMVYLSSISASLTPPWPGLSAYVVTKAAMDKMVDSWRAEHPDLGFTRVVVGDCAGGEGISSSQFMSGFDMQLLTELFPTWLSRGLVTGTVFDVAELVHVVDAVLRLGASAAIPTVTVLPRLSPEATPITAFEQGIPHQ